MLFQDRLDAGQQLARRLAHLRNPAQPPIVLGLPRGGVVVAAEVARALQAPLDVFISRKLGAPGNPELAVGAVTSDGSVFVDQSVAAASGASAGYLAAETERQQQEIRRRIAAYRGNRPGPNLAGRVVILVDDGVATGATTKAALRSLRSQRPGRLILAVPVGPPDSLADLAGEADEVISLYTPEPFWSVGAYFGDWEQTTDQQVVSLLDELAQGQRAGS